MRVGLCVLLGALLMGVSCAGASARAALPAGPTISPGSPDRCPPPRFPAQARKQNDQGTVKLRFLLGTDGRVKQVFVASSSGNAALDEAARNTVANCVFDPPPVNGKRMEGWADIQYVFQTSTPKSSSSVFTTFAMVCLLALVALLARRRAGKHSAAPAA